MPEEILSLDEIKRIVTKFVEEEWNGVVLEIQGNWPSATGQLLVHLVDVKVQKPELRRAQTFSRQLVETSGPLEEYFFRLQVSDKDRKVICYVPHEPFSSSFTL